MQTNAQYGACGEPREGSRLRPKSPLIRRMSGCRRNIMPRSILTQAASSFPLGVPVRFRPHLSLDLRHGGCLSL